MSKILVDYRAVYEGAVKMREHLSAVNKEIKDLSEMVRNLDIFWDGDTNTTFIVKINDDLTFMEVVLASVKGNIKCLNKIIDGYGETEQNVLNMIEDMRLKR